MTTPSEAIAVTGIIAIISIVLLAVATIPSSSSITANVIYKEKTLQVKKSFDISPYDYDMNNILDYEDADELIKGSIACIEGKSCDINQDGYIDAEDVRIHKVLVTSLYDYDRNGKLNKKDIELFIEANNKENFDQEKIYDINHDGKIDKEDLGLLTGMIYS